MTSAALQKFFVDALGGAIDVGLATPDDVIKHVTPEVLAAHLPRPLWAKLIAACLAAPRTDARLIVGTLGLPAIAEHIPGTIVWAIIADVGVRALGKGLVAAPPPAPVAAAKAEPVVAKADPVKAEPVAAKAEPVVAKADPVKAEPVAAKAEPVVAKADPAKAEPVAAKAEPVAAKADPAKAAPVATKSEPAPARAPTPAPAAPPSAGTAGTGGASRPTVSTTRLGTNPGVATVPPAPASAGAAQTSSAPPTATSNTVAPAPGGGTGTATVAPPLAAMVDIDFEDDDEPAPLEAPPVSPHRAPTVPGPSAAARGAAGNGARASSGAGASSRRPQASAGPRAGSRTTPPSSKRAAVSSEFDIDTDVHAAKDPASALAPVDVPIDDDLLDWPSSEETMTSDVDRKR